jgi:hypothetical protein
MRSADLAAHHAPGGCWGFLAAVARQHSFRNLELRASGIADPKRQGSRAAVLDERANRHASRLRAREEGSGSNGAILASGASNQTLREQLTKTRAS